MKTKPSKSAGVGVVLKVERMVLLGRKGGKEKKSMDKSGGK